MRDRKRCIATEIIRVIDMTLIIIVVALVTL